MNFLEGLYNSSIFMIFLTLALGYAFGRINFFGVKFGTSGVLIVALIMGHFGVEVDSTIGSLGLVLFLACVGLSAGPAFVGNLKTNFLAFLVTSLGVVVSGGAMVAVATKYFGIPLDLSLGISSGALTNTSSLAAIVDITGSTTASVGYGLAYVFGIIGIVLFVQLTPKFYKADIEEENNKLVAPMETERLKESKSMSLINVDGPGIFVISFAIVLGVILGSIKIPLPGGATFSLGNAGGTIIMGLLVAHFGRCGKISFQVPKQTLNAVRDLGISLFLLQNGTKAGAGFIETVSEYGIKLFLIGVAMTIVSTLISFIIARYLFKLPLFGALGASCGAMTSAPALNALISVSGDDRVSTYYAACQPVATIGLVLLPQIMVSIMG